MITSSPSLMIYLETGVLSLHIINQPVEGTIIVPLIIGPFENLLEYILPMVKSNLRSLP